MKMYNGNRVKQQNRLPTLKAKLHSTIYNSYLPHTNQQMQLENTFHLNS